MIEYSLTEGHIIKNNEESVVKIISREEFAELQNIPEVISEWIRHEETHAPYCKSEIEGEYLFGIISTPRRDNIVGLERSFYYVYDRKVVLLVPMNSHPENCMNHLISQTHLFTSIDDVFLTFLDSLTLEDSPYLNTVEKQIELLEEKILHQEEKGVNEQLLSFRKKLITIHNYYEQLITMTDRMEYEEYFNRNEGQLRAFTDRITRLDHKATSLREYCAQVRETFHSQTDLKMNRTMQTLTVITVLFMPVTVVSAWYGMNFIDMPELSTPFGYIITIIATVLLTVSAILYCKHKKIL